MGILLRYFYAHDYHVDGNGKPPLVAHARVYAIADKYSVGLLKDLAVCNFELALENVNAAALPSFIAAVEVIYSTTLSSDRGLRDCIEPTLANYCQELRDSDEFMALIRSGLGDGDFAVEVMDIWSDMSPTVRK